METRSVFCPDGLWQFFVVLLTPGCGPCLAPCSGPSSPGMYVRIDLGPGKYPLVAETSRSFFLI